MKKVRPVTNRKVTLELLNKTTITAPPHMIERRGYREGRRTFRVKTRQGVRTFARWFVLNADKVEEAL